MAVLFAAIHRAAVHDARSANLFRPSLAGAAFSARRSISLLQAQTPAAPRSADAGRRAQRNAPERLDSGSSPGRKTIHAFAAAGVAADHEVAADASRRFDGEVSEGE